jgi:hypothetical protein
MRFPAFTWQEVPSIYLVGERVTRETSVKIDSGPAMIKLGTSPKKVRNFSA